MNVSESTALLQLRGVRKTFVLRDSTRVSAVNPTDMSIAAGEIVALVGESGSGKSTLIRIALSLIEPDAGQVTLQGRDLFKLSRAELRRHRIAMQPVFQDSTAAFNPRRTIFQILREAMRFHISGRAPHEVQAMAIEILERVGLAPGRSYLDRYHHEISGGQRQRLAIARALAVRPKILIADEPLSGADVSIRGQILNLLLDLGRQDGLAILLVTHDISIAEVFANRVMVMYRGSIVEEGPARSVLSNPIHPYTRLLKAAVPSIDQDDRAVRELLVSRPPGEGCAFYARCVSAIPRCALEAPTLGAWEGGRRYSCFNTADAGCAA